MKAVNVIGAGLVVVLMGCGRSPCSRFARAVCEQAPNTPACERALRTTNSDECEGLLKDVDRFITLANEKVETPVLQPPSPQTPEVGTDEQAAGLEGSGGDPSPQAEPTPPQSLQAPPTP